MGRFLVLTLSVRQRALFDDILTIIDDFSDGADFRLAADLIAFLNNVEVSSAYEHVIDLIERMVEELRRVVLRCNNAYTKVVLHLVERSPTNAAITLYLRIDK